MTYSLKDEKELGRLSRTICHISMHSPQRYWVNRLNRVYYNLTAGSDVHFFDATLASISAW